MEDVLFACFGRFIGEELDCETTKRFLAMAEVEENSWPVYNWCRHFWRLVLTGRGVRTACGGSDIRWCSTSRGTSFRNFLLHTTTQPPTTTMKRPFATKRTPRKIGGDNDDSTTSSGGDPPSK